MIYYSIGSMYHDSCNNCGDFFKSKKLDFSPKAFPHQKDVRMVGPSNCNTANGMKSCFGKIALTGMSAAFKDFQPIAYMDLRRKKKTNCEKERCRCKKKIVAMKKEKKLAEARKMADMLCGPGRGEKLGAGKKAGEKGGKDGAGKEGKEDDKEGKGGKAKEKLGKDGKALGKDGKEGQPGEKGIDGAGKNQPVIPKVVAKLPGYKSPIQGAIDAINKDLLGGSSKSGSASAQGHAEKKTV